VQGGLWPPSFPRSGISRKLDKKLHSLLSGQKDAIVERWLDGLIKSYPADTTRFLRTEKDRFANPLGQNLTRGIHALVDVLLQNGPADQLARALDGIIRIRAVQELSTAQALGFVFGLKDVVHQLCAEAIRAGGLEQAQRGFEREVDELALLAFEIYLGCKKQLYELRVNEMKRKTAKLVERMNQKGWLTEEEEEEGR